MQLQEHRLGTLPAPEACIVYSRISAMLLRVLDEERKGSSRNRQKLWLNICTALKKSDCDRIKKKKNPKKAPKSYKTKQKTWNNPTTSSPLFESQFGCIV